MKSRTYTIEQLRAEQEFIRSGKPNKMLDSKIKKIMKKYGIKKIKENK